MHSIMVRGGDGVHTPTYHVGYIQYVIVI